MKIFQPYEQFSRIYDRSMDSIDYKSWVAYFHKEWERLSLPSPKRVLDLGCGTGKFGIPFMESMGLPNPKDRYLYMGVDLSHSMLAEAKRKSRQLPKNVKSIWLNRSIQSFRYRQMDIRAKIPNGSFSAPMAKEWFDLVVSTHTSLNYLEDPGDLFRLARESLGTEGFLFFDFTSKKNISQNFHKKRYEEVIGKTRLVWNTFWNQKNNHIEVNLTFYDTLTGEMIGEERHNQFLHELEDVTHSLLAMGFSSFRLGGDYRYWIGDWTEDPCIDLSQAGAEKTDMYIILAK